MEQNASSVLLALCKRGGATLCYEGGVHGMPLGQGLVALSVPVPSPFVSFTSISLPNNNLTSVSDLLTFGKCLRECPALTDLDLSRNDIGERASIVGEVLCERLPHLTSLNLSATGLTDDSSFKRLFSFSLTRVMLDNNRLLTSVAARKIACALVDNTTLRTLSLAGCSIDDAGAVDIVTVIGGSTTLSSLDLRNNPIKLKGGLKTPVLQAVQRNTSLSFFELTLPPGDRDIGEFLTHIKRQNTLYLQGLKDDKTTSSSFNNRNWTVVPAQLFAWKHMVSLNLSDNALHELPYTIIELQSLTMLNISKNAIASSSLPVHICKLTALTRLAVHGNPFVDDIPATVNWRDTTALMSYFQDISADPRQIVVDRTGRIVILGDCKVGKTTLVKTFTQALARARDAPSFKDRLLRLGGANSPKEVHQERKLKEGICITTVSLEADCPSSFTPSGSSPPCPPQAGTGGGSSTNQSNGGSPAVANALLASSSKEATNATSSAASSASFVTWEIWDLAPQLTTYPTHQFFLLPHTVFVVCFSLLDKNSVLHVQYWIDIILARCVEADVIFVATHRDKCANADEVLSSVCAKYSKRPGMTIHASMSVNTLSRSWCDQLKLTLSYIASKSSFSHVLQQPIPKSFLYLKALVVAEAVHLEEPTLLKQRFFEICDSCGVIPELRDLALVYLRRTGCMLWYDGVQALQDTIVCDAGWLVAVMARLVSLNSVLVSQDGSFGEEQFGELWPAYMFPGQQRSHERIIHVLESFEIVHRFRSVGPNENVISCYVVPCILPSSPPADLSRIWGLVNQPGVHSMYRVYRFRFLPPLFLSQLCVRMLNLTALHGAIWRTGVSCVAEDEDGISKHCLQASLEDRPSGHKDVVLQVTTSDYSGKWMHILVSTIESLLRGWFPATQYTRHIRMESGKNEASVDKLLETLMDIRSKENFHRLSGTIKDFEKVASDLLMRRAKRIRKEEIQMTKLIGRGAFGSAYMAMYEKERVVVKEIRGGILQESPTDTFGSFQNETYMMSLLSHPKIIRLIGICLHPVPSLVMEYMELGDLRHVLDTCVSQELLPWSVRIKILIDVALGMDFCHRQLPQIIHKDVKSPNVFLSIRRDGATAVGPRSGVGGVVAPGMGSPSLQGGPAGGIPGEWLVAKVADLGLATVLTKLNKDSVVDNPIWLAPELIRGQSFDEKIDVYAFGIIMHEVMTLAFPFEERLAHATFMSALAPEILKGARPTPLVVDGLPTSLYSDLMQRCWHHDRKERPSFRTVLQELIKCQKVVYTKGLSNSSPGGSGSLAAKYAKRKVVPTLQVASAPAFSMHDMGLIQCRTLSGIVNCCMYGEDGPIYVLHRSGVVSEIDIASGVGNNFGSLLFSLPLASPYEGVIATLPEPGRVLICGRGSLWLMVRGRTEVENLPSQVSRVAAVVSFESTCVVIGYCENVLSSATIEVRDLTSDGLSQRKLVPLFYDSQKILSTCIVRGGECVWILTLSADGQSRNLFTFDIRSETLGRLTVPLERFLHSICAVGSGFVWGLSADAIVVWKESGELAYSFDPVKAAAPTKLGMWNDACCAVEGLAVVGTTRGISLWNVKEKRLVFSEIGTNYSKVLFSSLGHAIALCAKLKIFAIAREVDSGAVLNLLKQPQNPTPKGWTKILKTIQVSKRESLTSYDSSYLSGSWRDESDALDGTSTSPRADAESVRPDSPRKAAAAAAAARHSVESFTYSRTGSEDLRSVEAMVSMTTLPSLQFSTAADHNADDGGSGSDSEPASTTDSGIEDDTTSHSESVTFKLSPRSPRDNTGSTLYHTGAGPLPMRAPILSEEEQLKRSTEVLGRMLKLMREERIRDDKLKRRSGSGASDLHVEAPVTLPVLGENASSVDSRNESYLVDPADGEPDVDVLFVRTSEEAQTRTSQEGGSHSAPSTVATSAVSPERSEEKLGGSASMRDLLVKSKLPSQGSLPPPLPVKPARLLIDKVVCSGFLKKRGKKRMKTLKQLYFELTGIELLWWKRPEKDTACVGGIKLSDVQEIECFGDVDKPSFYLVVPSRRYELVASSVSELRYWISGLKTANNAVPVYMEESASRVFTDDFFKQFSFRPRAAPQLRSPPRSPPSMRDRKSPRTPIGNLFAKKEDEKQPK